MSSLFTFLLPWEFSPLVLLSCVTAAVLYARGMRLRAPAGKVDIWRAVGFYVGLLSIYVVMQTHVDYLSQHMFWIHRLQHLVLHHLGPFLVMLSLPQEVMAAAVPSAIRQRVLIPLFRNRLTMTAYRILQQPIIASVLFAGLIFFWLTPSIHFDVMLSLPRYQLMNWSMLIDGLFFWWLIVDPRCKGEGGALSHGVRISMLWAVMLPQIALGAYITLTQSSLYSVYSVCGRAWPISPMVDQQLGGLITWIPASMMSVVGGLVVLRMWLRYNSRQAAALRQVEPVGA